MTTLSHNSRAGWESGDTKATVDGYKTKMKQRLCTKVKETKESNAIQVA